METSFFWSMLKKFWRSWAFSVYLLLLLALFLFGGGGIKTVWYVLAAISWLGFFFWERFLADSREVISYYARGAFLAFLFFIGLSYLYSSTPNVGLNDVLALMFGFLLFSAAAVYFKSTRKIIVFYRGVLFLAVAACFYGAYLYVFFPFDRFTGVFADTQGLTGFFPNAWADFVIMVYPFALFFLYENNFVSKRKDRILGLFGAVFLLAGILLSYSRGGWLSFSFMLFLIGALYLLIQKWQFQLRRFFLAAAGFLGIAILAVLLAWGLNYAREARGFSTQSFYRKATFQANEKVASWTEREAFFAGSLELLRERPLLGFGPGSFPYVYPRYQRELLALSSHPHSIVHKVAAENGMIALVLLFLFAAIVFAVLRHGLVKCYRKQWIFVLITASGLSGVVLHNVIDYNLQFLAVGLLFWILLGQLFALVLPVVKSRQLKRNWQWALSMVLVVSGVVIGLNELYYGRFLNQARGLEGKNDATAVVARAELYEKALGMWQDRDAILALARDKVASGAIEEAKKILQEAAPRHFYYAELWYFWGELLRQEGDFVQAEGKYWQALSSDPLNDLRYYHGYLLNLLAQKKEAAFSDWKEKTRLLLAVYKEKLRNNEHHTVLTANPEAARHLYLLLGEEKNAMEIEALFRLETEKLRSLMRR